MSTDLPDWKKDREARVTALLLGELSEMEQAEVERELASDPELAKLHAQLKRTIGLVRAMAADPAEKMLEPVEATRLSDERRQRLLGSFKTIKTVNFKSAKPREKSWFVPMMAAAALVLMLGLFSILPVFTRRSLGLATATASLDKELGRGETWDPQTLGRGASQRTSKTISQPAIAKAEPKPASTPRGEQVINFYNSGKVLAPSKRDMNTLGGVTSGRVALQNAPAPRASEFASPASAGEKLARAESPKIALPELGQASEVRENRGDLREVVPQEYAKASDISAALKQLSVIPADPLNKDAGQIATKERDINASYGPPAQRGSVSEFEANQLSDLSTLPLASEAKGAERSKEELAQENESLGVNVTSRIKLLEGPSTASMVNGADLSKQESAQNQPGFAMQNAVSEGLSRDLGGSFKNDSEGKQAGAITVTKSSRAPAAKDGQPGNPLSLTPAGVPPGAEPPLSLSFSTTTPDAAHKSAYGRGFRGGLNTVQDHFTSSGERDLAGAAMKPAAVSASPIDAEKEVFRRRFLTEAKDDLAVVPVKPTADYYFSTGKLREDLVAHHDQLTKSFGGINPGAQGVGGGQAGGRGGSEQEVPWRSGGQEARSWAFDLPDANGIAAYTPMPTAAPTPILGPSGSVRQDAQVFTKGVAVLDPSWSGVVSGVSNLEFLGYDDPGKFVPQAQAVSSTSIGVPITAQLPLHHFRVRQAETQNAKSIGTSAGVTSSDKDGATIANPEGTFSGRAPVGKTEGYSLSDGLPAAGLRNLQTPPIDSSKGLSKDGRAELAENGMASFDQGKFGQTADRNEAPSYLGMVGEDRNSKKYFGDLKQPSASSAALPTNANPEELVPQAQALSSVGISAPVTRQLDPRSDVSSTAEAAKLVKEAAVAYELRKLDEASAKLKEATALDPSNQSAYYYRNLVQENQFLEAQNKRDVTSRKGLVEVEQAWAEAPKRELLPVPPPYSRAANNERISKALKSAEPAKKEMDSLAQKAPAKPAAEPQPEVQTCDNAFSTFSLNISDVSFKLASASLEQGVMPDPASVRTEEFINAFDYRDPEPAAGAPVGFAFERAHDPFAQNRDLVRFGLKTAAQGRQAGKPLNIVLLLDSSGSMERADRVRILHEALRVLAGQLQARDKFSVITFARTARLVADGVAGNEAGAVTDKLSQLTPEGGTNLEEAMNTAYATALRHYVPNGINRVVLLTDGAANLGEVDPETLKGKVETNRKQGVALDCFGIGWEGLNDDLLETLTRHGDGRYGFLNTPEEAGTGFAQQLAGALHVAAADVKVQVEFNPKRVTSYRQMGYAKHQLTKQQFRDNTVDAAEIAAAEEGNALYVIETNPRGEGPLGTVRVRYKDPNTGEYHEHEWEAPYTGNAVSLDQASPAMRLCTTAAAFAEWLVASPYAAEVTPDALKKNLAGVPEVFGVDPRPKKLEWMIHQAKSLTGK